MFRLLLLCGLLTLTACAGKTTVVEHQSGANAAIVEVPNRITVMTLDGQDVALPIVRTDPYRIKVAAGQHQLQYYFAETFGSRANEQRIKSKVMALDFTAESGQTYRVDYDAPANTSIDYAPTFMETLKVWMTDPVSGQKLGSSVVGTYQSPVVALLKKDVVTPEVAATPAVAPVAAGSSPAADTGRLDAMQQLWRSATEAERKAFMNWIIAPN